MSAELIPQLQRLGQRLAQARQAQGISLDQQAERLHMGPEQLRALEEGNREELPEAVFVVAQAR
ncbi:MAG: helix-turn-helix domain-containing protein, partial [Cyanobium sp.]